MFKLSLKPFVSGIMIAWLAHAPLEASEKKLDCVLPKDGCAKVASIMKAWKSEALAKTAIRAASENERLSEDAQPSPELDRANAKAKERAAIIGDCYFDDAEDRIELTSKAQAFSEIGLAECLAGALAQARYNEVEAQWLGKIGEREAWIVKGGEMTKVAVENKLPPVAARSLWASFATRELVAAHRAYTEGNGVDASRAIANEDTAAKPRPDETSAAVLELLGL